MSHCRWLFGLLIFAVPAVRASAQQTLSFDRDVRPILSENCFKCHGPDEKERKAKLRLDERDSALKHEVFIPGKSAESKIVLRVTASDQSKRMPPAATGKKLTAKQIETLKHWIDEGAKYSAHWSFVAPVQPPVPASEGNGVVRNPIDAFILARLKKEGLAPSPEAARRTLIRRVTFDLTGLPPTLKEIDEFLNDQTDGAYEKLVDRLLNSPRFGERLALDWLDAARYADTHGYHIDSGRDMTKWREYVINAFNRNKPFDQFTIEQLAGDLLPNATIEQKIASGFNRNHMINFEGGAIPEEYRTAYIVDRVNTTGAVWLGLAIGCAQCHDHKFDPITQKEYYQLFAFFNNVPENGLDGSKGNAVPLIAMPTAEQTKRLSEINAKIQSLEKQTKGAKGDAKAAQQSLEKLRKEKAGIEKQIPTVMVMQEMAKPRDTFLLMRGQYDKKGEKVTPGVPAALPPLKLEQRGDHSRLPDRLDLAKWLVDPRHPLTSRVIVNRYWQMFFGVGLVKTSEDFGSQGEWPSHPELLDWLATRFAQDWNIKAIVRLMVTSATYRQSSAITPESMAKDPENRLLARMSRLRLPAEFIRDQALAVSGLLNGEIGGKSVFPYQPPGLWEELMSRADGANWTAQTYTPSKGKDLYRRTMYTFWKRTCPPPTLTTFDAPDREVCTVRRARTNTPLQALILLNDPTYVEASRKLAERMMAEAKTTEQRISLAFRLATARAPSAGEMSVLQRLFETRLAKYRSDPAAAKKLLSVGESTRNEALDPAEVAAWTNVAGVILNLDETVTRG
jgi:uncharacterized protein DUF1553/uncharacterized protein DUF1549/cytochrome c